jgi:hypothetical protein
MVGKPADYELPEAVRSPYSLRGVFYRGAVAAFNSGVTPGVMARTLGPFSRRIARNYTHRRLHTSIGIPREDAAAFEPYIFEILGAKGSGEVRPCSMSALHSILQVLGGLAGTTHIIT